MILMMGDDAGHYDCHAAALMADLGMSRALEAALLQSMVHAQSNARAH